MEPPVVGRVGEDTREAMPSFSVVIVAAQYTWKFKHENNVE
jgi:hypothetical protein